MRSQLTTLVFFLALSISLCAKSKNLISLHEENWRNVLKGEWMIEL